MHTPTLPARLARGALALTLACALAPTVALADETDDGGAAANEELTRSHAQANQEMLDRFNASGNITDLLTTYSANGFGADSGIMTLSESNFPTQFDLRVTDKVTPVKFQNPWGTCWGFATMAASETSILSSTGGVASQGLDLSELQLAWFTYTPLSADSVDEGDVNATSQIGEGYYAVDANGNWSTDASAVLDVGGSPPTSTSMLSSGTGPIAETLAPYKNKEDIFLYNQAGEPYYYSSEGDWSVDSSLRFASSFQLLDGNMLPSPAVFATDGTYTYNQAGTDAIKQELMDGRAVQINFAADQSMPGQTVTPKYINTNTWAHYTYEHTPATHAVTIVGWDDSYSASNFLSSEQVAGATQPPADGAWIVKNSWGAANNKFPNKMNWGIEGYFYLSYYDQSIINLETLEYDTSVPSGSGYHIVDQYDFLPSQGSLSLTSNNACAMANVFTATERQTVQAVSCETPYPNTTVTYEVYILNDGATQPKDGQLAATVTEIYQYAGYHRATLPQGVLLEQGQKYSVVASEKTTDANGSTVYTYLTDRDINEQGRKWYLELHPTVTLKKYAVGIVNEGESFFITTQNGKESTEDWTQGVASFKASDAKDYGFEVFDYDNFSVKAYSNPTPAPEPEPEYKPGTATATIGEGDAAYTVEVAGEFLEGSNAQLKLSDVDAATQAQLATHSAGKDQLILSTDVQLVDAVTGNPVEFKENLTLTFTLGEAYNGREVAIVHLPTGGTPQTYTVTVSDGKTSVSVASLSTFGVFTQATQPTPAAATTDDGKKLASTGDGMALPLAVAGSLVLLAGCAAAAAIVRRRRHAGHRAQ